MATLRSVVVDHIHDHFDTSSVKFSNRGLELPENRGRALSSGSLSRIAHVRGEEVDGVVTPVVDKSKVYKPGLRDQCLNRQ